MTILCNTLLANDREQAIPAEIGTTNKPIPVIDRVTDVAVELITTTVFTYSKIVSRGLKFLLFFTYTFHL